MNVKAKFGEYEVVSLDSPRHRHRGVPQFAVRDGHHNYLAYCRSEQEAVEKAKVYEAGERGK